MYRDDFAVFILSHGRANNVSTVKAMQKSGYTGKYYIVIDNEDNTADEYYKIFGKDKVIMFDKQAVSDDKTLDKFDNRDEKGVIYFARNACFDIAKELGLRYFVQFDDDYTRFEFRYEKEGVLKHDKIIKNLDEIFNLLIDFLEKSGALSVCFAQGGDFIGGLNSSVWQAGLRRKAMNSFVCSTEREFRFVGRINEDVNTYVSLANVGKLFFTLADISLEQGRTQANSGGMTEAYLNGGTYVKSFYTIICAPQAAKISLMGEKYKRMHHKISWNYCAPKILNEKWKKK